MYPSYIISTDPGTEGVVVVIRFSDQSIVTKLKVPTKKVQKPNRKGKSTVVDYETFFDLFSDIVKPGVYEDHIHVRERVRSGFGHAKSSGEALAYFCGWYDGVSMRYKGWRHNEKAKQRSLREIPPEDWHDLVYKEEDKVYEGYFKNGKEKKKLLTKETSINAIRRIYPDIPDSYWMRCNNEPQETKRTKIDDNLVEAVLMGYAARLLWITEQWDTFSEFAEVNNPEAVYPGRSATHKKWLKEVIDGIDAIRDAEPSGV